MKYASPLYYLGCLCMLIAAPLTLYVLYLTDPGGQNIHKLGMACTVISTVLYFLFPWLMRLKIPMFFQDLPLLISLMFPPLFFLLLYALHETHYNYHLRDCQMPPTASKRLTRSNNRLRLFIPNETGLLLRLTWAVLIVASLVVAYHVSYDMIVVNRRFDAILLLALSPLSMLLVLPQMWCLNTRVVLAADDVYAYAIPKIGLKMYRFPLTAMKTYDIRNEGKGEINAFRKQMVIIFEIDNTPINVSLSNLKPDIAHHIAWFCDHYAERK